MKTFTYPTVFVKDDAISDFVFAQDCGEFSKIAPMLRYVAGINLHISKKEYVECAIYCGFNPNTAAIQFAQSRKSNVDNGEALFDADGRVTEFL
jgi:hypothetical protein